MKTKISLLISLALALLSFNANSQIAVAFNVDATGYFVASNGMHLAGTFASVGSNKIVEDWNPAALHSRMVSHQNNVYSLVVTFPASSIGQQLQFLFVRNNIWFDCCQDYSEGNPGETSLNFGCGVDDVCCGGFNRVITIPSYNAVFSASFDHCGILRPSQFRTGEVNATEEAQLVVYPNPATDVLTLEGVQDDAFTEITNLVGQIVWSGKVSSTDPKIGVSRLPAGSYFLRVDGLSTIRFDVMK